MQTLHWQEIERAKKAAIEVLLHNAHGPYHGLPRTAGWGYPEPYTRDLMIPSWVLLFNGIRNFLIVSESLGNTGGKSDGTWSYTIAGSR